MPERDPTVTLRAVKTSVMARPVIRNWWTTYQLDKSDTNDSNKEDEKEDVAEKKQLSISQTLRTRQLRVEFDGGRPVFSLRAPLDLVQFPSISCPRWPVECEVISNAIHHIEWEPPKPEPFYHASGHEKTPFPPGEESRQVVYCIDEADKCPYFTCSRVGGSRVSVNSTSSSNDVNQTDLSLEFESRFESGNLQKAVQVGPYDYELTLRTDLYTSKHTQWFYFRVRNMKAGVNYRLTIVNLMKRRSLYSQGMKPLFYSERAATESAVGWKRIGSNITYYRSQNAKDTNEPRTLYSLTWTLQFPYESDTCYLAHCYPYTYSRLQRYLRHISSNPAVVSYCKVRVLCHSLAGNAVYVLTVTSRAGENEEEGKAKKAVVVTARVHPGETNASWLMEGFLDFLLGNSDDAQLLRDTFVFKVVPMLNPDGVVVGNYRCSLAGRDLNRNYKTTLRDSFPCVWHTRNMVEKLLKQTDVVLYCDFHGHNRKNNVFMYGCNNQDDDFPKLQERVFPLMLSKNIRNKFSFKSCKFQVQKSKEGTGRVAMWRLGIKNSYTMEATFGGSTLGDRKGTHFTIQDLKSLGFYFCDTLLDYFDPDPAKVTYCLKELTTVLSDEVRELGKELDTNFSVFDLESGTSGSDSSDSDGLPLHLLTQPQTVHAEQSPVKNKKKMTRKERDRLKSRMQPEILQSITHHIEPDFPHDIDNEQKDSIQDRPLRRHRRKWQVKDRKSVIPAANTGYLGISHVTLWQGFEPLKANCREERRAEAEARRKKRASSNINPFAAISPQIDQQRDLAQWRYSSKLLHLSALLRRPPRFLYPVQQQLQQIRHHHQYHHLQQHNFQQQQQHYHHQHHSYHHHHHHHQEQHRHHHHQQQQPQQHPHRLQQQQCVSRLLPVNATSDRLRRPMFDIVPTRHLPSSTSDDNDHFRDRNSSMTPNRYYVHQDLSSVLADIPNTKWQDEREKGAFAEVGLLKHLPFREINRRNLISEICQRKPISHPRFLVPVLRYPDLQGHRLSNSTLEDKRPKIVLPPVGKPSTSTDWHHR
ncbi:cytosolic carboxypeptidase 2 isoform X2 [Hippocampus comes]|uniref:cytosolic carboxypeptidase 2 isoform X2 n=1 Tax=Hippocampus comes TaxID=109280 RepID=UPI00094E763C|nr:PREDICTED: cytosolic carboxypeptidase 2-like isoform X2 [Hippocampus comes]